MRRESVSRHTNPALPAARAVQITRECQRFDRLPTRYSLSSPPLTARLKALFLYLNLNLCFWNEKSLSRNACSHRLAKEGTDVKRVLPHKPRCDLR